MKVSKWPFCSFFTTIYELHVTILSAQTVLLLFLSGTPVMQPEQQFLDELLAGLNEVSAILNVVRRETERQIDDVLDNALMVSIGKMDLLKKMVIKLY